MYGMEVTPYSRIKIHELETAHRQNARIVQGLPNNISRPAPLVTIGWKTLTSYIDIRKIIFLFSIVSLPVGNLFRKVVLKSLLECCTSRNIPDSSPVACMFRCVLKYELQNILINLIVHGNADASFSKPLVKQRVHDIELIQWQSKQFMYPNLGCFYDCIDRTCMHAWWVYVNNDPHMYRYVSAVIAILMGGQPKGLQCNFANWPCRLCSSGASDSPSHILFECTGLQESRHWAWAELSLAMPRAMLESMSVLDLNEKMKLVLNCYGGNYVNEWEKIYEYTAKMIYKLYSTRYERYQSLANL